MDLELRDRHVAVVGASGVLGQAIARGFAAAGARLTLLARDTAALDPLAEALRGLGSPQVAALPCDLRDESTTAAVLGAADIAFGPFDVLVCAAGAAQGGLFQEIDDAAWRRNLEVKLFGTLNALRAVAPRMVERRAGRIVLVVGNSARDPDPRMLPGAAANAALLAVVAGLAKEFAPHGVAIHAVNPGPVRSARWDRLMEAAAARDGIGAAEAEARALARMGMQRLVTPEEVAAAVLRLATPGSDAANGASVFVEGRP
jgi:NAD(P)-dependent dehydrogenase (short-subunit alcohol dehydrogenase family)